MSDDVKPPSVGQPAPRTIARPEGAVLGLDISESMVEAAERYARREGIENAEFRVIDSELDLGVRGESFDRATCRGALMFMPDPTGALSSLHEARAPGVSRAEVMQALEDRFPDGRVSLGMEHVLAAGVKAPE